MAISPQRLTIYLYSAHRAVIFAIAQLSCHYSERYCWTFMKQRTYDFRRRLNKITFSTVA